METLRVLMIDDSRPAAMGFVAWLDTYDYVTVFDKKGEPIDVDQFLGGDGKGLLVKSAEEALQVILSIGLQNIDLIFVDHTIGKVPSSVDESDGNVVISGIHQRCEGNNRPYLVANSGADFLSRELRADITNFSKKDVANAQKMAMVLAGAREWKTQRFSQE